MGYKDKKRFLLGADSDSDIRDVKGYTFASNCRVGTADGAQVGSIINTKGNTLITFSLPAGTNKCIGVCPDDENNAVLYCVYNSNKNHSILRYNIIQNSIEVILQQHLTPVIWDIDLNFDPVNLITSCYVIQGLFYWTGSDKIPRKINILKAKNFTDNLFEFYDNGATVGLGSNVFFYNPTVPVPSNIVPGIQVYIQQFAGFSFAQYNTLATVVSVGTINGIQNCIEVNIPYQGATPAQGGYISGILPILSNGYSNYPTINEITIDRIKWPPRFSPICVYQSDPAYNFNNLRGSTFQLSYKNVYDDNETSVASPISKILIPYLEEDLNGNYINKITYNNIINVKIKTGANTVKAIEIYARSNAEDTSGQNPVTVSCNYGTWYLIERIEKYDLKGNILIQSDIDYYYNFYNDKIKDVVDQADQSRLFDYVPIKNGTDELIEKNRGLFGDITEGYPNIDIDVTVKSERMGAAFINIPNQQNFFVYTSPISGPIVPNIIPGFYTLDYYPHNVYGNAYNFFVIYLPPTNIFVASDVIVITIKTLDTSNITHNYQFSIVISPNELINYPNNLRQRIENALDVQFAVFEYSKTQIPSSYSPFWIGLIRDVVKNSNTENIQSVIVYKGSESSATRLLSFKMGASHDIGLVYYDRSNRSGAVNRSKDSTVIVPFFHTDGTFGNDFVGITNISSVLNYAGIPYIIFWWSIKHRPPIWATHYQWVYSKNTSIIEYIQYYLKALPIVSGNYVKIKLNQSILDYNNAFPKSLLSTWIFEKGDRIRFIGNFTATAGEFGYYPNLLDYEIISYDGSALEFTTEYFDVNLVNTNSLVEVYRPKKNLGVKVFYEIGECFEIGDAGLATRYHKINLNSNYLAAFQNDQDPNNPSGIPARGILFSGDAYIKTRWTALATPNQPYIYCEDKSLSDFYVSDSIDIGRPNLVDRNMEQRKLKANYRWSGKLIQDTQINNLSRFDFLDFDQLPDKFGAIQRFVEVADVVKAVQEGKLTSIYVGLQRTAEADGTNNVYAISGVLGTVQIPAENYGSQHPESVCRWNRNLYFYDQSNGVFIRNAANGSFEISAYGKRSYFKTWQKEINYAHSKGGSSRVISAFDVSTEQLVVTLHWEYTIYHTEQDPIKIERTETLAFLENKDDVKSELSDQWKTNYSFTPEMYGYTGAAFMSFVNGALFLHNANPVHGEFYSVKYPQVITFVVNIEPDTIKRFLAFAHNSNKKWDIKLRIPENDNYPQGMYSELKSTDFVSKEGYYYAAFKKDMLTPGFATALEALINGRDLRGQVMEVTMINNESDEVVLYDCYVNLLPSPKSGLK